MQPEERIQLFEQVKPKFVDFVSRLGANWVITTYISTYSYEDCYDFYLNKFKLHSEEEKVKKFVEGLGITKLHQEHIDELLLFDSLFRLIYE